MKVLALIPARAGSKRLPGKNYKMLAGRPLVRWTLDAALEVLAPSDVLVSTDDPMVAEVARSAGVLVPWVRPTELSTDTATSVDVALHALDWYERTCGEVDAFVLLQPTSPFRSADTIRRGLDAFQAYRPSAVIGVSAAAVHPYHAFRIHDGALEPFVAWDKRGTDPRSLRTQDLPSAVVINGALYVVDPVRLRETHSFFYDVPVPVRVDDPIEAIDIDTDWDWKVAEAVCGESQ